MIWFILLAIAVRLATLAVSIRNEARMKAEGAHEYGARTTRTLAAEHVAFYLAAIAEGLLGQSGFDTATLAGLCLYAFAIAALFWVIAVLGRFWTVKLILATDHALVTNRVFRGLRHPNYFLNIIPELVGLALVMHAWITLAVGLPVYLVVLAIRIRQEEDIMRFRFAGY